MSIGVGLIVAWPFYALLGLPWLWTLPPVWWRLAPLVGPALCGVLVTWAWMLGLAPPWGFSLLLITTLALAGWHLRSANTRRLLTRHGWPWLQEGLLLYALALLVMSLSPFPVLGIWGGDWFLVMSGGLSVAHQGALTDALLARPPMVGAGAVPLWWLCPPLPGYQFYCAVFAAGALGGLLTLADGVLAPTPAPRWHWQRVLPVAVSAFFVLNTVACWSKLLAGGLAMGGIGLLLAQQRPTWKRRRGDGLIPPLLLGLGVAIHPGTLVLLPLVLLAARPEPDGNGRLPPSGWGRWGTQLALTAAAIALCFGLYEWWAGATYGWELKQAMLPTFQPDYRKLASPDPLTNTALNLATTFVGIWARDAELLHPPSPSQGWLGLIHPTLPLLTLTMLQAGTLVGQFWPYLLLRLPGGGLWRVARRSLSLRWGVAVVGVIIAQALVSPYPSPLGNAQNALAGLTLLGLGWVLTQWPQATPRSRQWTLGVLLVLGAGAWLVPNIVTMTALAWNPHLNPGHFLDADYDHLIQPRGLWLFFPRSFPWLSLGLIALLVFSNKKDPPGQSTGTSP